ncbi:uncharacterized protein L3040_003021 [Drepanopeziza brunnea f. sp. 'multigermtubi']|uniref:Uncharacterized protein n=1 Tax=Marssonina brunnea f. sp. multigermtubi (strain MB_m1) TaxID=1072389 RepID=K1WX03_MARBU|nr:uncharacterized protein MBM_08661 [Drepanopeziza brunnea f. sp. 'multigermtubi' MB_m1]EKD13218.1 hypothetical protein MBM_08661 [Drepanopeziza brunnea f. sp. 'multigermtubi' MB_m1]KAJ5047179.1 hypothetical protein L3040_003021 [Drepanopeziza brunnea f. sp. 'multigermtubi']
MGSGKTEYQTPPRVSHKDAPQYAETSMGSASLPDDVGSAFPDDELPPYENILAETPLLGQASTAAAATHQAWNAPPPDLPWSSHDLYRGEYRTRFPDYSTRPTALYQMVKQQAQHPPSYFVQLSGFHHETRRTGNKDTREKIQDFLISINITDLLGRGEMELLPDNKRGYRGTRIVSFHPTVSEGADGEEGGGGTDRELQKWCERYVADRSGVKSFTLKREIANHDQRRLETLLHAAIAETNYRGHLSVTFPVQHSALIVYSPGKINEWRITVWIRWLFYCSFLWLFAWPFLALVTARYETVKVVFRYADSPPGSVNRRCAVMTEVEWFHRWENAIKRAAFSRIVCKDAALDEQYRLATERADASRGQAYQPETPRTGNALADGAFGLLGQGLRLASDFNAMRGWGADC